MQIVEDSAYSTTEQTIKAAIAKSIAANSTVEVQTYRGDEAIAAMTAMSDVPLVRDTEESDHEDDKGIFHGESDEADAEWSIRLIAYY